MKKCSYCGRENNNEAANCHECGTQEFKGVTAALDITPSITVPASGTLKLHRHPLRVVVAIVMIVSAFLPWFRRVDQYSNFNPMNSLPNVNFTTSVYARAGVDESVGKWSLAMGILCLVLALRRTRWSLLPAAAAVALGATLISGNAWPRSAVDLMFGVWVFTVNAALFCVLGIWFWEKRLSIESSPALVPDSGPSVTSKKIQSSATGEVARSELALCEHCKVRVLSTKDGMCPWCGRLMQTQTISPESLGATSVDAPDVLPPPTLTPGQIEQLKVEAARYRDAARSNPQTANESGIHMARKIGVPLGFVVGFIVWQMVGGFPGFLLAVFLVVPIVSGLVGLVFRERTKHELGTSEVATLIAKSRTTTEKLCCNQCDYSGIMVIKLRSHSVVTVLVAVFAIVWLTLTTELRSFQLELEHSGDSSLSLQASFI